MSWMPGGTIFLLWCLLLSSSSPCFGSELDVKCLKTLQQSLIDPKGILKFLWNFNSNNGYDNFICAFAGVECWSPIEGRVLSLHLSNLGLEGQFPRGLEYCTSLSDLDMSSNSFSGPSDIARQLPYLASLDLSGNIFSGEIPLGISNMVYLNGLNLQHNQLSGQIPGQFSALARLTLFSVTDNLLSGPIPLALQKFPPSSFAGNQELCGAPLDDCPRKRKFRVIINDESIIGVAVGFVMGFVAAFYFPHFFVFTWKLDSYFFRI